MITLPVLHKINIWALSVTLVLYITIFFGMMAQMVLGIIQLAIALHITWGNYALDKKCRRMLKVYWAAAGLSLALVIAAITLTKYAGLNDVALIITVFVIPMLVAIYLAFVTNAIKRSFEAKP